MISTEKTKAIFRQFPDGDIIALFVEKAWGRSPYTCSSYMRVGQHGEADPTGVIQRTRPASIEAAQGLIAELTSVGYNLEIVKRQHPQYLATRRKLGGYR